MGCEIHSYAIDASGKIIEGGLWADGKTANPDETYFRDEGEPFGWRNYGVFGFIADVRNYSEVTPLASYRGLPDDFIPEGIDAEYFASEYHSQSWLSADELVNFDYDQAMIYKRCNPHVEMTYREFLGSMFFHDIAELQRIGADRVVFGFDG